VLSRFSNRVLAIDFNPERCLQGRFANVEFRTGDSVELLRRRLFANVSQTNVQAYRSVLNCHEKRRDGLNNRILRCAGALGETDENGESDLHVGRSELSVEPDTKVILATYRHTS
jgi:hypothetical protein